MKKSFIAVFTIALAISLCNCAPQDRDKPITTEQPQYNEKTNQRISMHGISFQIPKAWKKEVEQKETLGFAEYAADGKFKNCLAIAFEAKTNLRQATKDMRQGLNLWEEKGADIKNLVWKSEHIANMPTKRVTYAHKIKGETGEVQTVLIQVKSGVITINFFSPNKAGHDTFAQVLHAMTQTKGAESQ